MRLWRTTACLQLFRFPGLCYKEGRRTWPYVDVITPPHNCRGSVLEVERTAQAEHLAYVKTRACGLHLVTYLHI